MLTKIVGVTIVPGIGTGVLVSRTNPAAAVEPKNPNAEIPIPLS
jgi:ABC-type iron transport system FetAB permease component